MIDFNFGGETAIVTGAAGGIGSAVPGLVASARVCACVDVDGDRLNSSRTTPAGQTSNPGG